MRAGIMAALGLIVGGCSFDVPGTSVGDPAGTPTPSPTQSVPSMPAPPPSDGGAPPQSPGATPDMAQQRIGTACTTDAQCDPGLICATSFGVGPGRVVIPGGYCTHECSSSTCPANSVCSSMTIGKYCLSSCPPDPCRAGYVCCDQGKGQSACSTDQLCGGTKKDG
jgi:hypothetical protein